VICHVAFALTGNKDGRVNFYSLRRAYAHDLGVDGKHFTAYNMNSGCFGGSRDREMIVVQSLDGKLQIFEQSANAFTRQIADCLLPGPVAYVPKVDAFVTVNHACQAECYRYQVLASSSSDIGSKDTDAKGTGKVSFP
jgi:Bardet-Biedl syndrome 9 protein